MRTRPVVFGFAALLALGTTFSLRADNGAHTMAGGSFSAGHAVGQTITMTGASLSAGTASLTFSCPITTYGAGTYALNWTCAGGNITITSADKSLSMTGRFNAGSMSYTGSGGGKGGHTTYVYAFNGQFNGVVTSGGMSQLVLGALTQYDVIPGGLSGTIGWNSVYSPIVVADAGYAGLIGADNITGQNFVSYGSAGSGAGQFATISGLAHDAANRIYVSDSTLDRIARIDDLTGKNWTGFGSPGAGTGQFSSPANVTIDASGKIWVADAGNNRIVRFDDMSGTNWVAFGTSGTGVNQFSGPSSIAFDAQGRIYVADKGNNRLVRFDDLTGKNWASLSEILIGPYGYYVTAPVAVAVDGAGAVDIALGSGYLARVADITGASGSIVNWGGPLAAMSLDKSGTIYLAGGAPDGISQVVNAAAYGYFPANLGGAVTQPTAVLALATSSPPPAVPYLTGTVSRYGSANVGEPTAQKVLYLENLGAQPLPILSITSGPDFPVTDTCPASLPATANCRIYLDMDATRTGALSESLSIETGSVHPLLQVLLLGYGTVPAPVIVPQTLTFDPQTAGSASGPQTVTLTNTGTGPLTISAVAASAGFTQTNNCPKVLAAGGGCTVQAGFAPANAGAATGTLTFSDDAVAGGATQTVSLSGSATATAPAFTLSPEALQFPIQGFNTSSLAEIVTLTNSSGSAFTLGAPALTAGFSGSTTCGASLANGASCRYSVQFKPTAPGPATGSLTIPVVGKPPLTVGLSGTGVPFGGASIIAANPPAISFTNVTYGDNPSITATLTNTGGVPVGIVSIGLVAADPAYAITSNTCPSVLAGHAACSIQLTFTPVPTTPSLSTGTLTIVDSTGAQVQIPVTGQSSLNGS